MRTDKLSILKHRLSKIGIDITLSSNLPWVYLHEVNGKRVEELYMANHGFTIAFLNREIKLTDLGEIFKVIRKYSAKNK